VTRRFPPARLDVVAVGMTISFVLATATAAFLAAVAPGGRRALPTAAFAVLVVLGAVCLAFRPREFVLDERGLEVRRALRVRRIAAPLSAERVSLSALMGARLLGSGGLFGYLGVFRGSEGGPAGSVLTARRSAVLVRGAGSGVLLSPADPDGLLRAVAGEAV
jgi:cytochrome c biogenesis protein CcdA